MDVSPAAFVSIVLLSLGPRVPKQLSAGLKRDRRTDWPLFWKLVRLVRCLRFSNIQSRCICSLVLVPHQKEQSECNVRIDLSRLDSGPIESNSFINELQIGRQHV